MAASRFDNLDVLQNNSTPFELPNKHLAVALEQQQGRYDEGQEFAEGLQDLQIQALPGQQARASAILQDIDKQVDDVVSKYDGNFAHANKALRGLKNSTKKLFDQGGEAHSIGANFAAFGAYNEAEGKRTDTTSMQQQAGKNYGLNAFNQAADRDPETGAYKSISPYLEKIASTIDIGDKAFKTAEQIVPTIIKEEGFEYSDKYKGFVKKNGKEVELLSPDKIQGVVLNQLIGNAEVQDFVSQSMRFAGQQPTQENIMQYLNGYAQIAAAAYSKNNLKQTTSLQTDPVYMANYNDAKIKGRMRFKAQLDMDLEDASAARGLQTRYSPNFNTAGKNKRLNKPYFSKTGMLQAKGSGSTGLFGWLNRQGAASNSRTTAQDLYKNYKSGGDSKFPGPDKEMNGIVNDVFKGLEMQGVNLDALGNQELANLVQNTTNSYLKGLETAQTVDLGYGPKVSAHNTKGLVRNGSFKGLSYDITDENGNRHTGLTAQQMATMANVSLDDIQKQGHIVGYQTPASGAGHGEIMNLVGYNGRIVINETSIVGDNVMQPIKQISQVMVPGTDRVDNIDLSGILGPSAQVFDDQGRAQPFYAEADIHIGSDGILKRDMVIKNANGVIIPISFDALNQKAVQMLITSGASGINPRMTSTEKITSHTSE